TPTGDDCPELDNRPKTMNGPQVIGSNSGSTSMAPWLISISPLPTSPFCPIPTIFIPFRGPPGPAAASCETRPRRPAILAIAACETNPPDDRSSDDRGSARDGVDCDMPCDVTHPNDGDRYTFTAVDADRDVARKSL